MLMNGQRSNMWMCFVWMHDYVIRNGVWFSEINVWSFFMQRWMFLYRGIIFLNLQSDTCFIDWHASLLERMCSLVIGQQATSQFVVIFSNTFWDFSCIIISSELLLECCHSNSSLHLMKRYDAPIWIFNAACTEELAPTRPTPRPTLLHIKHTENHGFFHQWRQMRWDFSHSRNKRRPALGGCHWLDVSGDTADDGRHGMLGWTASFL